MAHYAIINKNVVSQVIVIDNITLLNTSGQEDEYIGNRFVSSIMGEGIYIQASYNAKFRGKFPSAGDLYDEDRDMFYTDGWTWNKQLSQYVPAEWNNGMCSSCHCHEPPRTEDPVP